MFFFWGKARSLRPVAVDWDRDAEAVYILSAICGAILAALLVCSFLGGTP